MLTPDLDNQQKTILSYNPADNTANNVVVIEKEKAKISYEDFKLLMEEYARNFEGDFERIYKQAKITTKTTKSNRDSNHYLKVIIIFLCHSLSKTYPDKEQEVKDLQLKLQELEKDLYKITRGATLNDNELFIPALFGITEGLL